MLIDTMRMKLKMISFKCHLSQKWNKDKIVNVKSYLRYKCPVGSVIKFNGNYYQIAGIRTEEHLHLIILILMIMKKKTVKKKVLMVCRWKKINTHIKKCILDLLVEKSLSWAQNQITNALSKKHETGKWVEKMESVRIFKYTSFNKSSNT